MSRFNKNGRNLVGPKLDNWVEQTVPEEPVSETTTATPEPPDTEPEPPHVATQEPKPKPQGKKRRNKKGK